jgi:hypothetical protein
MRRGGGRDKGHGRSARSRSGRAREIKGAEWKPREPFRSSSSPSPPAPSPGICAEGGFRREKAAGLALGEREMADERKNRPRSKNGKESHGAP